MYSLVRHLEGAFLVGQIVKKSACNKGDPGLIPGWENPLEEKMATHSSILAWRIPMDRGARWATVYRATKSQTWLTHNTHTYIVQFSSVQFNCSVVSYYLWPHGLQHARPPCPSPTARVYSNSSPLSRWCHPTISSSVVPFFSCLQSFPASGSVQMSQLFASGGRSIGVSASTSVLPVNIQDWFPLGWTGWISLQSKGLKSLLQHHSSKASILPY